MLCTLFGSNVSYRESNIVCFIYSTGMLCNDVSWYYVNYNLQERKIIRYIFRHAFFKQCITRPNSPEAFFEWPISVRIAAGNLPV